MSKAPIAAATSLKRCITQPTAPTRMPCHVRSRPLTSDHGLSRPITSYCPPKWHGARQAPLACVCPAPRTPPIPNYAHSCMCERRLCSHAHVRAMRACARGCIRNCAHVRACAGSHMRRLARAQSSGCASAICPALRTLAGTEPNRLEVVLQPARVIRLYNNIYMI